MILRVTLYISCRACLARWHDGPSRSMVQRRGQYAEVAARTGRSHPYSLGCGLNTRNLDTSIDGIKGRTTVIKYPLIICIW